MMRKELSIFGILILLTLGCNPEPENEPEPVVKIDPKQGKLKEIVLFGTLDATVPCCTILSYEYDNLGRVSFIHFDPNRTPNPPFSIAYEKLEYDYADRITRKRKYRANTNEPSGYRLESTTLYRYNQEGLLIEETFNSKKKFTYEYENLILKWRNEFETDGDLFQRIEFEYDQAGNKIAEWFYAPQQTISTYKMNFIYENNLLISSDVSSCMRADWAYDQLGRIETEQRVQTGVFCSLAPCVLRYYYFD